MSPDFDNFPKPPPAARFVGGVFGFVFAGVGLTLLFSDFGGGFGGAPMMFRVIPKLIALAFVAVGGATLYGAITGKTGLGKLPVKHITQMGRQSRRPRTSSYDCPQCGATLDKDADVSPSGDVKCTYCDRWFNVFGKG